jgi:hypothetical protein
MKGLHHEGKNKTTNNKRVSRTLPSSTKMTNIKVTHVGLDYGTITVKENGKVVAEYEVPLGLAKAIIKAQS